MVSTKIDYFIGGIASAAVLAYAYLGQQTTLDFSQATFDKSSIEWRIPDNYYQDPHYLVLSQKMQLEDQIKTIHIFVSSIVENTQDLDPRISKLIDENFWELG